MVSWKALKHPPGTVESRVAVITWLMQRLPRGLGFGWYIPVWVGVAALARQESRGAHRRLDFPELDPAMDGRHITIVRGSEPVVVHWE